MFGVGIGLVVIAAIILIPAILTQSIAKTMGKPITRAADPVQFWGTCIVLGIAASLGIGMIAAALLK